ncbi:hypothetical protein [Bacteroides acidifaciens]|uniref:hypothetical protein n=1 Tax=Bacteroides acidifaciens TaxID=85831 RepID=UPI00248C8386|nr:hypothetical protein [Bacteroides acidifaciens]
MKKRKGNSVLLDFNDFEITKRELLASISILAVMILIGVLISGKISDSQMDINEKYNKAAKIETQELFEYGMRTDIGNAFVHGDLTAVDTVTYPEIGGEYMYVEKVEENYNEHTRQVEHHRTVNGKTETYYTTETYWSWDYAGSEELLCKKIAFLGVIFDVNKIDIPSYDYITTIQESGHVRYKYYGVDTQFTGTIFTELRNRTILDKTPFYENQTIDETVDYLESDASLFMFWFFWIIIMAGCLFGFVYADNRWLD